MKLKELYELKLMDYKLNGIKENPGKLLAMLLLAEKDKYKSMDVSNGVFYNYYKKDIDNKIAKVEEDFNFSKEEIIDIIENKHDVFCDNYEEDKIWFAFGEGVSTLIWGVRYHSEKTPEDIFLKVYDNEREVLLSLDLLAERYKKLSEVCTKMAYDKAKTKKLIKK